MAPRVPVLAARIDLVRAVGVRRVARRRLLDRRYTAGATDRAADVARALWADAAAELGAEMRAVGGRFFEFTLDGVVARVSGQSTPLADPVSIRLANDKPLAAEVLSREGVPTPPQVVIDGPGMDRANAFLLAANAPCIAKPAAGGGGHAVTGHITTLAQLRAAVRLARTGASHVLLEQMIEGDHYRFLLLDGRLLDVLHRRRPQVVGDGRLSIEELILTEYRSRLDASPGVSVKPFRFDLDCVYTLAHQGLRLDDIPGEGVAVEVKTASNFGGASETTTYRGRLADALVSEVRAAARAVGARLAGVDVITSDPSVSLATSGGVILEVNPVPGLMHHYAVANPAEAVRVAVPILEVLLSPRRTGGDESGEPGLP